MTTGSRTTTAPIRPRRRSARSCPKAANGSGFGTTTISGTAGGTKCYSKVVFLPRKGNVIRSVSKAIETARQKTWGACGATPSFSKLSRTRHTSGTTSSYDGPVGSSPKRSTLGRGPRRCVEDCQTGGGCGESELVPNQHASLQSWLPDRFFRDLNRRPETGNANRYWFGRCPAGDRRAAWSAPGRAASATLPGNQDFWR